MINKITAADVVHPLAQAGVELPEPKEPKVADTEGIKGVDSTQQPAFLPRLHLQKYFFEIVFHQRIPDSPLSPCSSSLVSIRMDEDTLIYNQYLRSCCGSQALSQPYYVAAHRAIDFSVSLKLYAQVASLVRF